MKGELSHHFHKSAYISRLDQTNELCIEFEVVFNINIKPPAKNSKNSKLRNQYATSDKDDASVPNIYFPPN